MQASTDDRTRKRIFGYSLIRKTKAVLYSKHGSRMPRLEAGLGALPVPPLAPAGMRPAKRGDTGIARIIHMARTRGMQAPQHASVAAAAPAAALGVGIAGLASLAYLQWTQLRRARCKASARQQVRAGFEHRPAVQRARVLVLGDSTGVGIGAASPKESLAGLLATDFPNAEVVNASIAGARVKDVVRACRQQAWADGAFDVVLLHVGGNDVLRLTAWSALARDTTELLACVSRIGRRTIWLGVANIGLSPLFIPPFSWWLSARTRKAALLFDVCARRNGAEFVSFFRKRRDDPFSREYVKYFSEDGLHPSSYSYRYCYEVIRRQTRLVAALKPAAERRRHARESRPLGEAIC